MSQRITKEWTATVTKNSERGGGYHVLQLEISSRFPQVRAGAFLMMSVGKEPDILLRRPMAIYDLRTERGKKRLEVLFSVVGRGTRAMLKIKPGQTLSFLGPLGNAFDQPKKNERVTVVAGGVGIAPFLLWGRQLHSSQKERARILLGFRNQTQSEIMKDFRNLGLRPLSAIEGPGGHFRGTVVDLFRKELQKEKPHRVLTCGPEVMMEKVIDLARQENIPCEVSLEAKMGCGLGVCLSCVTDVGRVTADEPYRLVCQDGPIFQIN